VNVIEVGAESPRGMVGRAALGLVRRSSATELPDTTYIARDVTVSLDRLAGYAKVCGFHLSDLLPPTYPHILAFPLGIRLMTAADFPLPMVGLIHIENRIEQMRPIGVDEHLELTVRAADLRPHERGRCFDVRASASVGDEVVWRGISTYLRRSGSRAGGQAPTKPAGSGEPPAASAVWRVGRDIGPRYARVSGDHNPIHTSRLGARAFGFARPIAHGMWSMAACLAALEGRLPDAYAVQVAFRAPILLPARVAFSTAQRERGWTIALHDARTGRTHLTGETSPTMDPPASAASG
jgi:acyl dehydratase